MAKLGLNCGTNDKLCYNFNWWVWPWKITWIYWIMVHSVAHIQFCGTHSLNQSHFNFTATWPNDWAISCSNCAIFYSLSRDHKLVSKVHSLSVYLVYYSSCDDWVFMKIKVNVTKQISDIEVERLHEIMTLKTYFRRQSFCQWSCRH